MTDETSRDRSKRGIGCALIFALPLSMLMAGILRLPPTDLSGVALFVTFGLMFCALTAVLTYRAVHILSFFYTYLDAKLLTLSSSIFLLYQGICAATLNMNNLEVGREAIVRLCLLGFIVRIMLRDIGESAAGHTTVDPASPMLVATNVFDISALILLSFIIIAGPVYLFSMALKVNCSLWREEHGSGDETD